MKIIFDTDMASDCDDAGALAVLHALADLGEAEILAVVTNRKDPSNAAAAAAAAINTWYGRPRIPIGTDKDGAKTPPRWNHPSSYCAALRDEFPHNAKPYNEMPDALEVYCETLATQPDGSVVICSVGALSNLCEAYWTVVEDGRAVFDSDGHSEWRQDWRKRHAYARILGHPRKLEQILGELLAAPPRQRPPQGGRQRSHFTSAVVAEREEFEGQDIQSSKDFLNPVEPPQGIAKERSPLKSPNRSFADC